MNEEDLVEKISEFSQFAETSQSYSRHYLSIFDEDLSKSLDSFIEQSRGRGNPMFDKKFIKPAEIIFKCEGWEDALYESSVQKRYFLVSLINRNSYLCYKQLQNVYSNKEVVKFVSSNFVFYQEEVDFKAIEKNSYTFSSLGDSPKSDLFPFSCIINPISGKEEKTWTGITEPEKFIEELEVFFWERKKEQEILRKNKELREQKRLEKETQRKEREKEEAVNRKVEKLKAELKEQKRLEREKKEEILKQLEGGKEDQDHRDSPWNRSFFLTHLKQNGYLLYFASEELRNDEELVRIALKSDPGAIIYVGQKLRKEIC